VIRPGACRKGSDPKADEAIAYYLAIEQFLTRKKGEGADLASGYAALAQALGNRR
jgi:flagellar biosynthesis/type III secretory pathway ATPase